jgi:hypothetical protein
LRCSVLLMRRGTRPLSTGREGRLMPSDAADVHFAPGLSVAIDRFAYDDAVFFEDFAMRLEAGRCTVLLGPSGCGKTTLLRLIAGHLSGARVKADDHAPLAGRIAFMAQQDLLLPWLERPRQRHARLPAARHGAAAAAARARRAGGRDFGAGRSRRVGRGAAGAAFRRHAPARRVGPHADGGSAAGADGRAVLRRRRHHPLSPAGPRGRSAGRAYGAAGDPRSAGGAAARAMRST